MTGNLFDSAPKRGEQKKEVPLPELLRPEKLEEIVGLEELLSPGRFLRNAIENDRIPSLILWGPPGSGKTTIARIIARSTKARFVPLSATSAGIKDIKAMMEDARRMHDANGSRTIIFIDEIHRFNKAQQDAFLPYVEAGDITLIGATTENPSFEINSALLSRSKIVVIPRLEQEHIVTILQRAVSNEAVSRFEIEVTEDALLFVAATSAGDARQALNSLQLVVQTASKSESPIDATKVKTILQRRSLLYDKGGDEHYGIVSALHKSIRNGDTDATMYWLVRMLEGGEDPMYIARRLVRAAAEDIGLADPEALRLAIAARDALHFIGMPEGGVVLAELAIYLAQAPKSNALYAGYEKARREVREGQNPPVPLHIRNAPTSMMKDLGYGAGYTYAHNYDEQTTPIECLPDSLAGTRYYEPKESGRESEIKQRVDNFRAIREKQRAEQAGKTPPSETDRLHP